MGLITKLFGTRSQRELTKIQPFWRWNPNIKP